MKYVKDISCGAPVEVPICLNCVCAHCSSADECHYCDGETEDTHCCKSMCAHEEDILY